MGRFLILVLVILGGYYAYRRFGVRDALRRNQRLRRSLKKIILAIAAVAIATGVILSAPSLISFLAAFSRAGGLVAWIVVAVFCLIVWLTYRFLIKKFD
jgi:uncharacterized membrane protein